MPSAIEQRERLIIDSGPVERVATVLQRPLIEALQVMSTLPVGDFMVLIGRQERIVDASIYD